MDPKALIIVALGLFVIAASRPLAHASTVMNRELFRLPLGERYERVSRVFFVFIGIAWSAIGVYAFVAFD